MPVYEYRCEQCGQDFSHLFRTIQAAEEGKAPPCPACGAREVQKVVSSVVALSGSEAGGVAGEEEAATESKTRLFGRKELQEAIGKRKNLS